MIQTQEDPEAHPGGEGFEETYSKKDDSSSPRQVIKHVTHLQPAICIAKNNFRLSAYRVYKMGNKPQLPQNIPEEASEAETSIYSTLNKTYFGAKRLSNSKIHSRLCYVDT